eukprot:4546389-Amphidinium_carterae.1
MARARKMINGAKARTGASWRWSRLTLEHEKPFLFAWLLTFGSSRLHSHRIRFLIPIICFEQLSLLLLLLGPRSGNCAR